MPRDSAEGAALRRVAFNTAWLAGSEIVGRGLSLLAIIHLSRSLLPRGMGIVDIGIALFVLGQTVARGGFEVLSARRIARSSAGVRTLAGTSLAVSYVYVGALVAVIATVLFTLSPEGEMASTRTIVTFASAALLTPLALRFVSWGREQMRVVALSEAAALLVFLLLVLALIDGPGDLWLAGVIWVAVELVRVLPQLGAFVRDNGSPRWTRHRRVYAVWLASSLPLTLARLGRALFSWTDVLLLGLLASPAEVGLYGAASRLPRLFATLGSFFSGSAFPPVVRAMANPDHRDLATLHGQLVQLIIGATLPTVVVVARVAQPLVVLLFGPAFAAAGVLLQLLVWRSLLGAMSGLERSVLLADRPSADLTITLLALVAMAGVTTILVPLHGPLGAAMAAVGAEGLLLLGYAWSIRKRVDLSALAAPGWLLRLGIGIAMIEATWAYLPDLSDLLTIAALSLVGAAATLLNVAGMRGRFVGAPGSEHR